MTRSLANPPKLSVKFGAGLGIGIGGFVLAVKQAKMVADPVNLNVSAPLLALLVPTNAFLAAGILAGGSLVAKVLRHCGKPKILASIVETIAVYVVNMKRAALCGNQAVHVLKSAVRAAGYGANCVGDVAAHRNKPLPDGDQRDIFRINYGLPPPCQGHEGNVAFNADGAYGILSQDLILQRSVAVRAGRGVQPSRPVTIPQKPGGSK